MWTTFKQVVHDKTQISDIIRRFNSIVAYLDTNVIYFGQLLSGAEQDEFCFVTNVLTVTDHFTKYAEAYVTPKQTAVMVARTLWENFLVHYG